MRSAVMFAGLLFTCSLAQAAAAQTFNYEPGLFGQQKKAPKPPKVDWNWRPFSAPAPAQKPAVICGMTLVPGDRKVDPKMKVVPSDRGVAYALRVVPPTVCKAP
jgi:hypothetical protein